MKRVTFKRSNARETAELQSLSAMTEDEIDTGDIPEVKNWTGARRGLFFRPIKKQLTLRLDADLVAWFKAHAPDGAGYQTRINSALRDYVDRQEPR